MIPLLAWTNAEAHQIGLSAAALSRDQLVLTFAAKEIAPDGLPGDLGAMGDSLLRTVSVETDGGPCVLGRPAVQAVAGDAVEFAASLACPDGDFWTYSVTFLGDLDAAHRHHVSVNGESLAVVDAQAPMIRFHAPKVGQAATLVDADASSVFSRFFELGVEHIWTGYDHLAFLFVLLLAARSFREMLGVITGFTLAHSVTLSLGATGLVTVSPALVEPAIALTVAYAGVENLWEPPARRRLWVTTGLGLIHGFGFAGMLSELGLPPESRLRGLLAFNLGVEVGQAVVAGAVLPVLLAARASTVWRERGVPATSMAIALLGLAEFVRRLSGA